MNTLNVFGGFLKEKKKVYLKFLRSERNLHYIGVRLLDQYWPGRGEGDATD